MQMGKSLMLSMWMLVLSRVLLGWGVSAISMDDARERFNIAAGDDRLKAEEAKQKTNSWIDWAHDKFSPKWGLNPEKADDQGSQNMMGNAGDAAARATGTINSAASEASRYASQKAGEAVHMAHDKMRNVNDYWHEKAYQGIRMASDRAEDAGETVAYEKDEAANAYDQNKDKLDTASDRSNEGPLRYGKDKAAHCRDEAKEKMNMASDKAYNGAYTMAGAMTDGGSDAASAYDEANGKGASGLMEGAMEYGSDKASHTYDEAKKQYNEASSMASDYAKETMADAKKYGRDKAANAYDEATEKMNWAPNMASDAKDTASGAMEHGREEAANAYSDAKNMAREAYVSAKEYMSEKAKTNYEAAKEMASDATGDLGPKMRNDATNL